MPKQAEPMNPEKLKQEDADFEMDDGEGTNVVAVKKKKAEDLLKQDLKLEEGGDDGGERGDTRKLKVAVEPM